MNDEDASIVNGALQELIRTINKFDFSISTADNLGLKTGNTQNISKAAALLTLAQVTVLCAESVVLNMQNPKLEKRLVVELKDIVAKLEQECRDQERLNA